MPIVSVILTVFQRVNYLPRALQSATTQTLRDIEIIVTDDSDSAEIRALCEAFGDKRIRYRSNPSPLGVALNVKSAIAEANGDFVSILNDDDEYLPDFLEKVTAPLRANAGGVLAFSDHWIVDENSLRDIRHSEAQSVAFGRADLAPGEVPSSDLARVALLLKAVQIAMSAAFRRDALPLERVTFEAGGAYDFWFTYLLASHKRPFFYVAERLTLYRVHQAMETARLFAGKGDDTIFVYRNIVRDGLFPEAQGEINRLLSKQLVTSANIRICCGDGAGGRAMLREALRVHPTIKAVVSLATASIPGPLHCFVSTLPRRLRYYQQLRHERQRGQVRETNRL